MAQEQPQQRVDGAGGVCVEVAQVAGSVEWRTSSRSGGSGNCVELAAYGAPHRRCAAAVRDSKDPDGSVLSFRPDEWAAFALKVKTGAYDL